MGKRGLEVNFENEEGIDASGLSREWYDIVCKEILEENVGLWKKSANGLTF